MRLSTLILISSLLAPMAFAAEKAAAPKAAKTAKAPKEAAEKAGTSTVTCKHGAETRTIAIEHKDGGGCDVVYTKGGQAQSIASARNEVEYCDGVVTKMKGTLESAGFKCD